MIARLLQRAMSTTSTSLTPGPVHQSIQSKLSELLKPTVLEIKNDSWQHRHHAAMRDSGGGNGETHFTVRVVSEAFVGKSTMQRHRMIYGVLSDELAQGLHALSLQTKTPEEIERTKASGAVDT